MIMTSMSTITKYTRLTGRIGGGLIRGFTRRHITGGVGITVGIPGLPVMCIMAIRTTGLLIVTTVAGLISQPAIMIPIIMGTQ